MKSMFKLLVLVLLVLLPAVYAEGVLPGSLQIIEEEAFCGADSISEIALPEGLTEIRARAFAESSLTAINLPSSLTFIADDAFSGCDAVTIAVSAEGPAWDWCVGRGLTGAEWTAMEQADSDSVTLSWIAPDGVFCNVWMNIDGEWTVVASELTGGEYSVDGLSAGVEHAFALEFTGTETVADGETALAFSYSIQTDAQTITLLDCDYSWWIQNGECILTGATLWEDAQTIEVSIPAELGGCPVTRIGSKAFTCMSALSRVFIPDTVTRIDSTAFYGCANLTAVEMTGSVLTIGDHAFAECTSLSSITLSDSITAIGSYAFLNDAALMNIELPASLVSLGKKSLYGTGLTSIALPDALTEIGAQAWDDDIAEIITGEQAVTFTVSEGVLYANGMSKLVWVPRTLGMTEYASPETVTELAAFAFASCETLASASFPGGLTLIGEGAFENCTALTAVAGLGNLITLGDRAFYGCALLTDDAFHNLTCLESVGAHAFHGCTALESMPFPESLLWLGESAFEGCTALVSAALGAEMTGIGSAAFYGCTALESVEMPESLSDPEGFGSYIFYNCASLQSICVPAGVIKLDNYTFNGCTSLTTLTLPQGLETIGGAACFKCNALTGLIIPDSVTSIGAYAFTYCRALTEIDLPACPVGSYGFAACSSLKSVRFADSGANISLDNCAFYLCSALESAYLPANVTSIHAAAFESCPNVTLYVKENSPAHTFAVENNLGFELTA